MSQRREEFFSAFMNNPNESNIKSILRKTDYHDSNISESVNPSVRVNAPFYDNRTSDEWTMGDPNQRRINSGLLSKSGMSHNQYANMPIYPDEEMQVPNSVSAAEKSKQYNTDLYVQALLAKSDLGLIDKAPVSSALEALRAYGPRQQSPIHSPVHRNWFENVQHATSSLPEQYGSSHIKSASVQHASAFSTSINSGRESPYSKDNISFQKANTSQNVSSGIKSISEVVLQSVDDEDEYLYGDSNPLPDEPRRNIVLEECTSEVPLKEVSGWSDDEDISSVRNLKSSSLHSLQENRKFSTNLKGNKTTTDMKSEPLTWKNSSLSELHSKDKRSSNSDNNYEKDTFLPSRQNVSLSEKVARTFSDENKAKSAMSNYQILHSASFDNSKKLENPKKDLQSTNSPKVSTSELKSKYHAAADILKKGITSKKSSNSEILTSKEPIINRKDASFGNKKTVTEIKKLSLGDKSEKGYLSSSSNKFPKLLININQGEKTSNKRIVHVRKSERTSAEHGSSKIEDYINAVRSGGTPDKYFDDKVKKDVELFLSDMEKSAAGHRIIRDRSDGNYSKNLNQHAAKGTQEEIRELPKAYSLSSDKKRSVEYMKHTSEKEFHSSSKEKMLAHESKPHSYERGSRDRSPIRRSPDRYHSPRLRSPGRVSRKRSHDRSPSPGRASRKRSHEQSSSPGRVSRKRSHERSPHRSYERSPRRRSRTRRDSRSPRRKSRARRESRSPKRRSCSPRRRLRDSSPYRSHKRDSHYRDENKPRHCHERRSEKLSVELVSDMSSDDEITSENSLDRESRSPSRHSKEGQVERISSDKSRFHVKSSDDIDNLPECNSLDKLKNTLLNQGTAKVEKNSQITSNRNMNTSEDMNTSKSELLRSEADSSRSSLDKEQLLILSDGMKCDMSSLTDNPNASGQVKDMVQLFEMMQNAKMLNDLSQVVEEVKQAKQASQQSVPLESEISEDANQTVEPVSVSRKSPLIKELPSPLIKELPSPLIEEPPKLNVQPLYSQTYSYNAHIPTSMPPPFPVDNHYMYPSYPPPISTSSGYAYPSQYESYAPPFPSYAPPFQSYAPQLESYVPQSQSYVTQPQSYAPQPQPESYAPLPESYPPDVLPTIRTKTSKKLKSPPVSGKRRLCTLKSVPVDGNISSTSKKKSPLTKESQKIKSQSTKESEEKLPLLIRFDKPAVPAAMVNSNVSVIDNNVVLEKCKKLSEERDAIQKKLRNTSDAVIELKKLRGDLETSCRKNKSTADKQTLSQCRSLFDKASEELNTLIADAKRIDAELKSEKAKLPKELVKFNYKTEAAETKPKESAVTYTCYDTGAHWCQHCNEQFPTILVLLEHLHWTTHKQNVGRDERPWAEKKMKKEKQSEGQDSKNSLLQPAKGLEFMKPFSGFYCSLCEEVLLDHSLAELHVKSHEHMLKYMSYCKENPVYERKFELLKKVGLAAKFKEKKKRFLEEKQQIFVEKQKVLVKRRKLEEDADKKIKEKLEKERKNEKLVEELEEVNVDQSSSPQKMSNIKLTLVNEKEKKSFDWKKNPKESETKMKPRVVYIGRAPNFKPRLKPADKNSSSTHVATKESAKELNEISADSVKSSNTYVEEGKSVPKLLSEKVSIDIPTSASAVTSVETSKISSKSLNSKVSETVTKNKQSDIMDKSKVCVSGCQNESETRISNQDKTTDKPMGKSLVKKNDKGKHVVAETLEPAKQDPLINQAIRNILYGDDGSKSSVQISEINLPAPPPSPKPASEKQPVLSNKDGGMSTPVDSIPKPSESPSFNAKPQQIKPYVTARNTGSHKILTEEEKDFLLLGIDKSDMTPLAIPKPPPSALIQSHNELSQSTGPSNSSPTMSSSNSLVTNVNASNTSCLLNPVNVGENISHVQHIPVKTPTKTLPPFPPPIQIPPPNVVVKYTPPPIVTIPKPNPCDLNNVSPQVFNTIPQHTHFATTVPSYTISTNIQPIREQSMLSAEMFKSCLIEVPFNDVRTISAVSHVNSPSNFNQECRNTNTLFDPWKLPLNPEMKENFQTVCEYSNIPKESNNKDVLLTDEVFDLKGNNFRDIIGKTITECLPSPPVSVSASDIKDNSNIHQKSKFSSVTSGANNDTIYDNHKILISGLKTAEVDVITDESQSNSCTHSAAPCIRKIGSGDELTCFEIIVSIFDAVENNTEYPLTDYSNSFFSIEHAVSDKGVSKTMSAPVSKEIQNSEELSTSSKVVSSENKLNSENIDFQPNRGNCLTTKECSGSKVTSNSSLYQELQINLSHVDGLPDSESSGTEYFSVNESSSVVSEAKEYVNLSEASDIISNPLSIVSKLCSTDHVTDNNQCTSVDDAKGEIFSSSQLVNCSELSPMFVTDTTLSSSMPSNDSHLKGEDSKIELKTEPDSYFHLLDGDSNLLQEDHCVTNAEKVQSIDNTDKEMGELSTMPSVDIGKNSHGKTESVSLVKTKSGVLSTDACEMETKDLSFDKKMNEVDLMTIRESISPQNMTLDSPVDKKVTEIDLVSIKEFVSSPKMSSNVENICDTQLKAEHTDISSNEENKNLLLVENQIFADEKECSETLAQHLLYENVSISPKVECEETSSNLLTSFSEDMEIESQESSDIFASLPGNAGPQNQETSTILTSFPEDMEVKSPDSLDLLTSHLEDMELKNQDKSGTTQEKSPQILEPIHDQNTKAPEFFNSGIINNDIPKTYLSEINPNVLPSVENSCDFMCHTSDLVEEKILETLTNISSENKIPEDIETDDSSQNVGNSSLLNQSVPAGNISDNQVSHSENAVEMSCTFSTDNVNFVDNNVKSEKSDNAESEFMCENKLVEESTLYIKEDFNAPPLTAQSSSNQIDCVGSSFAELEPSPPHLDVAKDEEISILKDSETEISRLSGKQMCTSAVPCLEKYDVNDSVLRNTDVDPPILIETVTEEEHNIQFIDVAPEESREGDTDSIPAVITSESSLADQDFRNGDLLKLSAIMPVQERKKKTDSDTDEYENEV